MAKPLTSDQISDLGKIIDIVKDDFHEYVQFTYELNDNLPPKLSRKEREEAIEFVEYIIKEIAEYEKKHNVSHIHLAYLMTELHSRGIKNLFDCLGGAREERFRIDNS
jgi:hypothetical protein